MTEVNLTNVRFIGNEAFSGCVSLSRVVCYALVPPTIGAKVFNNNASDRKIYVPMSAVRNYKTASNWSEYASAIQGIDWQY